ncbi:MAG: Bax inhibitor-1/YccA family protein [Phytoplasma sp.]|uniref:Bax inhibitor-1/YccA family membrane protein n=1 Tax=Phytoplasma sp. TaxID=2155 RepID=UPI002B4105A5|nr:Bax inhibitor-1/YccA family protein [Phytoplasma sp.]WRH06672.1 MAG: Bax inhibitor-1/YccA family protein [Phytoplasma sp.]
MLNVKTKVNNSFVQIKDNFLNTSSAKIIYQNKVTRFGIVAKTILLLLITSLSTILSFVFLKTHPKFLILAQFLSLFYFIIVVVSFRAGINSVEKAKLSSFIYSIVMGMMIGTTLSIFDVYYHNVFPLSCIALFATFLVFLVVSYLYYKGYVTIDKDSAIFKKIFLIAFILFLAEIFSCIVFAIMRVENVMTYNIIAIPINLFFIYFGVSMLIIHFNYVEDIITKSMPKKYEWQLSLAFVSLFINIFMMILDILMRLLGSNKRQ